MKRITLFLVCLVSLMLNGGEATAQQLTYPEDMLNYEYPYFTTVKFKGASPNIADFLNSLIEEEDAMPMDSGNIVDAWSHYLRHEKQEPGTVVTVDQKNGYISINDEYTDESEDGINVYKGFFEVCYWNCADGKHKLFALNQNAMENGRYFVGQTTGLTLNLYDNGRHIMWDVVEEELGLDVEYTTYHGFEFDAETGLYHVQDHETGEPLTLNEEDFFRWQQDKPVVTYWLPKEGKDIIAEIHYATRTHTVRLVWDGMRFNRQ